MARETKNLLGQTIGQWFVINPAGIINKNMYWNCRCSCGTEKIVKAQYLIGRSSTKCRACADRRANIENEIPQFYWRHVESNANKRDIKILINKELAFSILQKQNFKCAISGLDIIISKNYSEHALGLTTASLDRIDSSKEYEPNNIQWLHKDINTMKNVFHQKYFISLCAAIVSHHGGQQI